jgi:hypothetical protein
MACCKVLESSVVGNCRTGGGAGIIQFVRMCLQQENEVTAGYIISCTMRLCAL